MVRLRDAVLAVGMAIVVVGCTTFCDECDDFPIPGGPGGYSMMPGSYTGPPMEAPAAGAGAPAQAAPAAEMPAPRAAMPARGVVDAGEAVATPPIAPPAGTP